MGYIPIEDLKKEIKAEKEHFMERECAVSRKAHLEEALHIAEEESESMMLL